MADNDKDETDNGPIAKLRNSASANPATQRLFNEAEDYVSALAQHLLSSVGSTLGKTTQKLTDAVEGDGVSSLLARSGKKVAEGENPARAGLEAGAEKAKDKIKGAFSSNGTSPSGSGSDGSGKFNNIVEDVDVGVPVRTAYDQWVNYQDFSQFTRGVLSVDHVDEVTTNWKAKVAKSQRSWKATVTEQIPDERIAWTSEGAKGSIKGVVTFHALGENLTRILLVIEYYPSGFFEKTANLWWAASRRVRLDLKHYRRFVMRNGEATQAGWRGTIRDGEVVQSHDDAVADDENEEERQDSDARSYGEEESEQDDQSRYDEFDEDDDDFDDEEEDYDEEDEPDEDEDEDEDDEDEPDDDEDDEQRPQGRARRSSRASA